MEIRIESLLEGAQRAKGTVIIVDVFRAFTTGSVAFSRGVEKIVLVAEVEEALESLDGRSAFEHMHRELDCVWAEVYRVLISGGFACIIDAAGAR